MADVIYTKVASPVTTGGTVTFAYPLGQAADAYIQDEGAILFPRGAQNTYVQNTDFTLSYGELVVTLTVISGMTIPAIGSPGDGVVAIQLPRLSDTVREGDALGTARLLAPLPGADTWIFS